MVAPLERKLLRDLWAMKAQVGSIVLIIALGVCVFVGAWRAFQALRMAQIDFDSKASIADLFVNLKAAPWPVVEEIARWEDVELVEGRVIHEALLSVPGQAESALGLLVSIPETGQIALNRPAIRDGEMPVAEREPTALVHEAFANAHGLKPRSRVEFTVGGVRRPLVLTGIAVSPEFVYAIGPRSPMPDDRHYGVFWLPRQQLQAITGLKDGFNALAIKLRHGANWRQTQVRLEQRLKEFGVFGVTHRDRIPSKMFVNDEIRQQRISAFVIPGIFLMVAAFLLQIMATRIVTMQRSQIATLRACGVSKGRVASHYFLMMLMIGALGTALGFFLGEKMGELMIFQYQRYFRFPNLRILPFPAADLAALLVGTVPGLVATWGAIRQVYQLAPAEAMRPPVPAAFRQLPFENWALWRGVGILGRMRWRHLFSHPIRLATLIMGVAMGLSLIVITFFWLDLVQSLVTVHFRMVQRESLEVSFMDARPTSALQELAGIPGVLRVEGYRQIGIRVHHRGRTRDTALTGMPAGAELLHPLNQERQPIEFKTAGLTMTRSLAERLNVRLGEDVMLESLDGRERKWIKTVSEFSDDLMGAQLYLPIDEFWRLMGESPNYNLARLHLDPLLAGQVYLRLKEMPQVAAVHLKETVLKDFQRTFADAMGWFLYVLVFFSLSLSLGVIFNASRIALSERGWEFASLRVLGFSRDQVFQLFFGELAIPVLIAVPLAIGIGVYLSLASLNLTTTEMFEFPAHFSARTIASLVLAAGVALVVSLELARRRMSSLSILEALKARE